MEVLKYYKNLMLILSVLLMLGYSAWASENPKDHIDYWQKNYDELLPKDDPRVEKAQRIFNRVLNAAGRRPGIVPRLFIVKTDAAYIPLAFAIPDGGIIISKKVLDICYKDPKRGDDRLAFILGHEIAHQLKDDFWHQRFFQAVMLSKEKNPSPSTKKLLEEVKSVVGMTDKVLSKEIQADEYGIIYASMAGFNTRSIITEDESVNFFEYVASAMDPDHIKGVHKDATHPSPAKRSESVTARLKQVLDKVDLFNLGLLFYQSGNYEKAILFFSEFLRFFPSREVYHDLAASYHQLALSYYKDWKKDKQEIPFKLSVAIDPETRANKIVLKGGGGDDPEQLFKLNIEKAIQYYTTAISQDSSYVMAYSNLGSALIIKGEVYKAIGILKDALKLKPDLSDILNNLGVAFFYAENTRKAVENLKKANKLSPRYNDPLFNLGRIAYEEKKEAEAKQYWLAYLKLDPYSPWADLARATISLTKTATPSQPVGPEERTMRLEVGASEDNIPPGWGKPIRSKEISIEEYPFKVSFYNNGFMTLSQDDEIQMIAALGNCQEKTSRGIALGEVEETVLASYGSPTKVLNMNQGESWVYEYEGIAFRFVDKKVAAWMLF
jgi:tetratricopeptide (TPR) repeat protein